MAENVRTVHLPAELPSVTVGRHFARDVVLAWGLDELVDDIQLCTSELVTNAIRHAGTSVTMTLRRSDVVTVEVTDGITRLQLPKNLHADVTADHGRGLHIVAAISHDWGVLAHDEGKTIWFTLSLPDSGRNGRNVFSMAQHRGGHDGSSHAPSRPADAGPETQVEQQARATG